MLRELIDIAFRKRGKGWHRAKIFIFHFRMGAAESMASLEPEETRGRSFRWAHGKIEHIGRYDEFAQAMNRAGLRSSGTIIRDMDGQQNQGN